MTAKGHQGTTHTELSKTESKADTTNRDELMGPVSTTSDAERGRPGQTHKEKGRVSPCVGEVKTHNPVRFCMIAPSCEPLDFVPNLFGSCSRGNFDTRP